MSGRSILLGLLLAAFIAGFTYFNDAVIRQTYLIGNLMPAGVFGVIVLLMLVVNPLMSSAWRLRPAELGIICALGLAACCWPGSNLHRFFLSAAAMPNHLQRTQTAWQAAEVMSYVPGASSRLAVGFVPDPKALAQRIVARRDQDASPEQRVWSLLSDADRSFLTDLAAAETVGPTLHTRLVTVLNQSVITRREFYQPSAFADVPLSPASQGVFARPPAEWSIGDYARLNRDVLSKSFPGLIRPAPRGEGLLVSHGEPDPQTVEPLVQGSPTTIGLGDVPWAQWWPTLRLWLGVVLALGLATLCLAVIVHPQWAHRELLTYPLVRFVNEAVARHPDPKRRLPAVGYSGLFWIGVGGVVALHFINGLQVRVPELPLSIPLQLGFGGINTLFPTAAKVWGFWSLSGPVLYLSVIAFAYFLSTEVSFSLGISLIVWLIFGTILLSNGIAIDNSFIGTGNGPMLRFGAYVGMTLMLLYVGRRYYSNVFTAALGRPRQSDTPVASVWAARAFVPLAVIAVWLLADLGGMGYWLAVMLVMLTLMAYVVMARINAETGTPIIQPNWSTMGALAALFGVQGLGMPGYAAIGMAFVLTMGDPRETLMPYLTNALRLGDGVAGVEPRRSAPWLAAVVVGSLALATIVLFVIAYNFGVNKTDAWATNTLPSTPFVQLANAASELQARGELVQATAVSGLDHFRMAQPQWSALGYAGLGFGLVLACAIARLRLPWWPLHPVLFLVLGSYPAVALSASFFVGFVIKVAVVNVGGLRTYQAVKPLAVGVIAGELLSIFGWMIYGLAYFVSTGQNPAIYGITLG